MFLQTIRKTLTVVALASVTLSGVLISSGGVDVLAENHSLNWREFEHLSDGVKSAVENEISKLSDSHNYRISSVKKTDTWGVVSIFDASYEGKHAGDIGVSENILYQNIGGDVVIATAGKDDQSILNQMSVPNYIKSALFPNSYSNQNTLFNSSGKWKLPWKNGVRLRVSQGYLGEGWGPCPARPGIYTCSHHLTRALDFSRGVTDAVAAKSGVIYLKSYNRYSGNYVVINHGNSIYSYYLHLSSTAVNVGDSVVQGQKIGVIGNSGSNSTGIHLDFRVCKNIDPKRDSCNGGYPGGPTINTPFEEVLALGDTDGIPNYGQWYTSQNRPGQVEYCGFVDIANHALRDEMCWTKENGLISGNRQSNGKIAFRPDDAMTRLGVAIVANRLGTQLGLPQIYGTSECVVDPFTDTDSADANNLKCHGLVSGYTDGTYDPNASSSRAVTDIIITRVLDALGYDSSSLLTAENNNGDTTRAAAAVMLQRAGLRATCGFEDIKLDNPFRQGICDLVEDDVVSGYEVDGAKIFRPDGDVSRAAIAKFITKSMNVVNDTSCGDFSDVPSNHGFYEYITPLKCAGIIGGYSDGTFRPDGDVTRGAATKFIINAKTATQGENSIIHDYDDVEDFSDVPTDHPFYEFIMKAKVNGLIGGYGDGTFRPEEKISRGAVAHIVNKARVNTGSATTSQPEEVSTPENLIQNPEFTD